MNQLNTSSYNDGAAPVELTDSSGQVWVSVSVHSRIDSFNQSELTDEIKSLLEKGRERIVLDLRSNRFLSFQAIRFCVETAKTLSEKGGAFALLACPEKTKRHFEIYGTLKNIQLFRSERDFKAGLRETRGPAESFL